LSLEVRDNFSEDTTLIEGKRWHLFFADQALSDSDAVIVFSERRCLVYNTSTRSRCHVGIGDDLERAVRVL
jgi:hypothetical protein